MARKKKLLPGMREVGTRIEYRFRIDGKQYSVRGSTVDECLQRENEKRESLEQQRIEAEKFKYRSLKEYTVMEYLEKWLDNRSGKLVSSTICTYKKLIRMAARPAIDDYGSLFGDIPLKDLETEQVRIMQKELQNENSTRTTNDVLSLLNHALETAVKERVIEWNPAAAVERLRQEEEPARNTIHRSLTKEETTAFLDTAAEIGSWYCNLYTFLLNSGLRIGEAGALTPQDVNREDISVSKTVIKDESGYRIAEQTKTDAARRIVDTRPDAWDAVRKQQEVNRCILDRGKLGSGKPVFRLPRGGILRPDRVNTDIKRICEKAGIERFTCHAFRATFASRCIADGVSVKHLMEILGHTDVQMTMGLYGHGDKEQKRAQILAVSI